ncbi:hypothetical protein [Hymenobacter negativus]|uniref:DUF4369 domain-containing protein n=1 Tax=Hymenobacter negativus TaxID=2795026 RepID=A0ABS3QPX1_9BACT|nr:hypothetical protein [Hymenobacter negativus]MBO2012983.1 hypothetical protein [Hymenobacter negativus]
MNNTAKALTLFGLMAASYSLFQVANFRLATVLKGPIQVTYFTKERFVVAGDRYLTVMDSEINGPASRPGTISLATIDVNSFHFLPPSNSASTSFADKDFTYIVHHGEDPYIMRECK